MCSLLRHVRVGDYLASPKRCPVHRIFHPPGNVFADCTMNITTLIRQGYHLAEGVKIIPLPYQAPNANAHAERWVRTARDECLDHILIWNDVHLRRVLIEFVGYYNTRRPHQSLNQQSPVPHTPTEVTGSVARRQVLGGIINDYYRTPTGLAFQSA